VETRERLAMIGLQEILIIGLLIVLIFGSTQIPKLARALGQGLKELKKGIREAKEEDEKKPDTLQENKKDE
jgi:sec-independent protein translocase protein TatA